MQAMSNIQLLDAYQQWMTIDKLKIFSIGIGHCGMVAIAAPMLDLPSIVIVIDEAIHIDRKEIFIGMKECFMIEEN